LNLPYANVNLQVLFGFTSYRKITLLPRLNDLYANGAAIIRQINNPGHFPDNRKMAGL